MDKEVKHGPENALAVAQGGVHVPEKDFSSKEQIDTAAGTPQFQKPPTAANTGSKQPHGFGHPSSARDGKLRCSGHSGAHRIGKKK